MVGQSHPIPDEPVDGQQGSEWFLQQPEASWARLRQCYHQPTVDTIPVRGATYLQDRVKVHAGPCLGQLLHVDLISLADSDPKDHIARWDRQREGSVLQQMEEQFPELHVFIVNFQLPGDPFIVVVLYWAVPLTTENDQPFEQLYRRFIDPKEPDEFRLNRMKLIPNFVAAPWIISTTVPQRPAITGRKFAHRFFHGKNYIEVDLDLASSRVTSKIVSLCRGYATSIAIDISFTLQGEAVHELPETNLCGGSI